MKKNGRRCAGRISSTCGGHFVFPFGSLVLCTFGGEERGRHNHQAAFYITTKAAKTAQLAQNTGLTLQSLLLRVSSSVVLSL